MHKCGGVEPGSLKLKTPIMAFITTLYTELVDYHAEALPDSDYLSLLRYLEFFSVLYNRLLADNLSQLQKCPFN